MSTGVKLVPILPPMVPRIPGNTVLVNDGDFGNFAEEAFCLDDSGCVITADINVSHATSSSVNDGVITINTNSRDFSRKGHLFTWGLWSLN